jgi:hypothetical protein
MHNWSTSLVALTVGSLLTFACTSQSDLQEGGGAGGVASSGGMAVGGAAGSAMAEGGGGSSAMGVGGGGMHGTGGLGGDCICDYKPSQDGRAGGAGGTGGAGGASFATSPDVGALKDSSAADGPVICSCPMVPASCPYGYQIGPAPCGCLSCAPAPSNLDAGRCSWPANLTPSGDESAVGCWAYAVTGKADGGTFACSSSEYSLDCVGAMPPSTMSIPAPDSSLGCRILPIPTPSNRLYHCCPCDGATVAP